MCRELRLGEVGVKFVAGGFMHGDPRPREAALNLVAAEGLNLAAADALQNAVESIQKQYPDLQTASLKTDGGGENHNMLVEDFLTNIEAPVIIKLHALKEVKFSNSAVEAVNKIIKRYLRKKLPDTLDQLIQCLKEIINDYNTVRPHGSLLGLTPMECYTSENVNLDFKEQKLNAKKDRIIQNKSINCGIDACKR